MSDLEYEENIPIVDCDVLEAAKENIQPLASGRRVTALSAVLSTPHGQRESQHNSVKSRHRINITIAMEGDDPDDDPLEAYCRFVYWTLDAYPQGHSAESGLLELLEEATRVLKDDRDGHWRGDMRYLKLWVLYASFVEKPAIIYKFLLANDIGTQHALLYEEHAAVLERAGRRTDADEAYMLGIARQAEPLDRLQNKHREFQKRMMSSASTPAPAPAPAPSTTKRTVLGSSKTPSSSSHDDPFTVAPSSAPRPNGRLQVFVDPSGAASQSNAEDDPTPYPDVGTRKTRVKENVPETKKAGGTTLKQAGKSKRVASGSGPSKIAVFRDGDGDMPPPPIPAPSKTPAKPSGSKIAIFKDEEEMPPPPVPSTAKTPGKPKSGIVPFKDEVPSTPTAAFTPFRDEQSTPERSSPSGSGAVPESVMKLKAGSKGAKGPLMTSEAEALRKDPLKNYGGSDGME